MKLSFVIPTYNCAVWLPHAVSSCLGQTFKDIEVVVVDDCSTDRTGEYLDWLKGKDKRVRIFRLPKNVGRSEARNIGNKEANGEIIAVLDADDIATPNRAELTLKKFKGTDLDYVYGGATFIDAIGRPLENATVDVFDKTTALEKMTNGIVHSSSAYTKKFAMKYRYRGGEISRLGLDDWALQIESLLDGGKFDFIPHRLCAYRILSNQISRVRNPDEVMKAKKDFLASLKVVA